MRMCHLCGTRARVLPWDSVNEYPFNRVGIPEAPDWSCADEALTLSALVLSKSKILSPVTDMGRCH